MRAKSVASPVMAVRIVPAGIVLVVILTVATRSGPQERPGLARAQPETFLTQPEPEQRCVDTAPAHDL